MNDVLKPIGLGCIYKLNIIPKLIKDLQISDIIQQVKIIVNENETEAAGMTFLGSVGGEPSVEPQKPIAMNVNRPFIFEIAEDESNTILFTGIINNIE